MIEEYRDEFIGFDSKIKSLEKVIENKDVVDLLYIIIHNQELNNDKMNKILEKLEIIK